jgi:hypothetical protein
MPRNVQRKRKAQSIAVEKDPSDVLYHLELGESEMDSFFKTNLKNLYLSEQLCDISFKVGNSTYEAHKIVLAASNTFLSGMIMSGMRESVQSVITIKEDPKMFKYILDYIYGVRIDFPSSDVVPLLSLANNYSMMGLRDKLGEILTHHLKFPK